MKRPASRCVLIGFGRRAVDDHIPALIPAVLNVELVAVADADPEREASLKEVVEARDAPAPRFYTDLDSMLDIEQPDFAIVATPHATHLSIAEALLIRHIPFLKEKPFAISLEEARQLESLIERYSGHMRLCVQRHQHPLYVYGKRALAHLGTLRHYSARYQLNADKYYSGWRSRPETAGGGAVIDMGYHLIDLLYWYFGTPTQVYAVAAPKKDEELQYTIEETVLASLAYANGTVGSLFLSLCEPHKHEELRAYGTHGYIHLQRDFLKRYDPDDNLVESLTREPAWPSAVTDVLAGFLANLNNSDIVREECVRGVEVMATIESIYRSVREHQPIHPREVH